MIHAILCCIVAAVMVCNFHWRGSETSAGKFFIREYYFMPSEDNKHILEINDKKLATKTPAGGFFRGINKRIKPDVDTTEEEMRVVIDAFVEQHVSGRITYTTKGYSKGEYRPESGQC